mmetsp:Transcript_4314/g.6105  ORF Transcript_4314/g.6105 Transcript_4314/m.6105 type:complete len:349 (-) Transcript_4314:373-1419(-)
MAGPSHESLSGVLNQFDTGLCDCCAASACCCFVSFCLPCGSRCVAARAMAQMEDDKCGSLLCCWYCCCASHVMMRGLARTVYGIYGSPGNDTCIGCCCTSCSAIQILNHANKNDIPKQPPENPAFDYVHEKGCFSSPAGDGAVCSDPINCCFLCALCTEESASHGSQTTGLPFWFHYCCGNYFVHHHIIRIQNGVPGSTCWHDCWQPLCCALFWPTVFCPCISYYFAQQIFNEYNVIKQAAKYDQPRLFDPLAANAIAINVPIRPQAVYQQYHQSSHHSHNNPSQRNFVSQQPQPTTAVAQHNYVDVDLQQGEEKNGEGAAIPMVVLDASAAADELQKHGESHYYRDL